MKLLSAIFHNMIVNNCEELSMRLILRIKKSAGKPTDLIFFSTNVE